MSADESFSRSCYRCDKVVRMTEDEFRLTAENDWTICPECRVKLDIEANFAGASVSSQA